jgi:hypothetical protein
MHPGRRLGSEAPFTESRSQSDACSMLLLWFLAITVGGCTYPLQFDHVRHQIESLKSLITVYKRRARITSRLLWCIPCGA